MGNNLIDIDRVKLFLKDQLNILVDINISIKNMTRLKDDQLKFEESIKSHGFFQHHWYQLKFILVIQLFKLFSNKKNDKRSFYRLFNYFESTNFPREFLQTLHDNSLETAVNIETKSDFMGMIESLRIMLKSKQEIIDRLIELRDRAYAHKDPNSSASNLTFENLVELVNLSNQIYNRINRLIYFEETDFDMMESWDIGYILFHMNESFLRDEEDYRAKIELYKTKN